MQPEIYLTNTRTRRKEMLVPITPGRVGMYVCGPTVYDRAHMGNARPVIVFDILYRLLRHVYGTKNVTYVRNFTDVDDKINARAAQTGREITDITRETIAWYLEDMAQLGALEPTHMPRATDYIDEMLTLIERLVARGNAYVAEGHVLFAVDRFAEYGALANRSLEDMLAGARVEVAPYKRNPMDFVLWKPSDAHEPGWESAYGRGRPGWHIECSAMARSLLGGQFDIHGGGNDLQFPHHENEIAQSRCAHPDEAFAKLWLHNEMLLVDGKKMSKSLGNFFTVRDLLDRGIGGDVIRLVFLSTHYSRPMDWTDARRQEAERTLRRWRELTSDVAPAEVDAGVVAALANDLNTAAALTRLHEIAKAREAGALLASARFLGLLATPLPLDNAIPDLSPWGERLRLARIDALQSKDFTAVDALRNALWAAGVEVRMSKEAVELVPGPLFDASKLPEP